MEDSVSFGTSDDRLNLIGVDDSGEIGVSDFVSGEVESLLLDTWIFIGSEDVVELFEGSFSPDDESSDVPSWCELEEVKSADMSNFDSWNVSEGLDEGDIGSAVDNKRTSSGSVSSVSKLSFSCSNLDSVNDFLDISVSSDISQESDGFLSSFDLFSVVVDDQGEFWDAIDSVSSGLNQGEDC